MAWAICLLGVAFLSSPWHPLTQSQSRTYSSNQFFLHGNCSFFKFISKWDVSFSLCLLLNVEYVGSCLVDVLTQTSLAHLPLSRCFPLLPFYVFLGAVLLVHKCGKYWLNVCILASSCSSVMSWIWQTILQLHVSVTDILPVQT